MIFLDEQPAAVPNLAVHENPLNQCWSCRKLPAILDLTGHATPAMFAPKRVTSVSECSHPNVRLRHGLTSPPSRRNGMCWSTADVPSEEELPIGKAPNVSHTGVATLFLIADSPLWMAPALQV
jgi:hypothetical protein